MARRSRFDANRHLVDVALNRAEANRRLAARDPMNDEHHGAGGNRSGILILLFVGRDVHIFRTSTAEVIPSTRKLQSAAPPWGVSRTACSSPIRRTIDSSGMSRSYGQPHPTCARAPEDDEDIAQRLTTGIHGP